MNYKNIKEQIKNLNIETLVAFNIGLTIGVMLVLILS